MSDVGVKPVDELEDMLDAEIPCGGISEPRVQRSCDRAAILRCGGHGCPDTRTYCKCIPCWRVWYQAVATAIACYGSVGCATCRRRFATVESFADYRPF